jgi:hypothetical protein
LLSGEVRWLASSGPTSALLALSASLVVQGQGELGSLSLELGIKGQFEKVILRQDF